MAKTVLVFDFGASSARAMLCRYEDGQISLEEIHRFPNKPITENGRMCWDIDELFEQMKVGISFGVFSGGFDAISIDTWGVDFGLIGRDGALLSAPVHYRDARTQGMREEVCARISAQELYERTGVLPQDINTIFQLHYLASRESNELFRVEKLLMMPDLFAYLLTGKCRSEYTEATTTQLIDCRSKGWDIHLIELLGLPKRMFCPLIHAGEVYGMLKEELAEEFLCEPVPVIACPSHDTASAALAVPSAQERFAFISCGTWTLVGTELSRPLNTREALDAGLTNEGGCGGKNMLLRNIMGLWLIQEFRRCRAESGTEYSFADMESLARGAEPFVSFIDPNCADFTAPEDMPAAVAEYCRRTGQPVPETDGALLRCIYQSLACEFALAIEQIERLTHESFAQIHMIGGGTQDSLLCELTACACGRPAVAGPVEATALGNALSTLIALGEIGGIAEARRLVASCGMTKRCEPADAAAWSGALQKYRAATGR